MKLLALSIGPADNPQKYVIGAPPQLPTGGLTDTILPMIGNIVSILLVVVAIVSLFSIIASGIQWSSSGGDEKALEKAKGRLKYSIIGLIVALISFGIIQFIAGFFGVSSPFPHPVKACVQNDHACSQNSDCCSNNCIPRSGAPGIMMCN